MSDVPTPQPYMPVPYRVDADEDVTCPHCNLKDDTDAIFCDQCGTQLAGRNDVTVDGEPAGDDYAPEPYEPLDDETVQCPDCQKMDDPDARFCDQCGAGLVERMDVTIAGPVEDIDGGVESGEDEGAGRSKSRSGPPRENLIRARYGAGVELRDAVDGSGGTTMFGHFSVFNSWYEIDSYWEGTFMESVASSAFDRTMVDDRAGMKVLYDHGFDPQLGNKPLGPIDDLRADNIGAYYEVPLLDTDYNRDFVLPALRGQLMSGEAVGSQLGSSFRFIVLDEIWESKPEPSDFNPQGLPQRTITRAQVLEFGPVTFPASPSASSGVRSACRSTTDGFVDRLRSDPLALARFTDRTSARVVEQILAMPPSTTRQAPSSTVQPTADDVQAIAHRSFQLRARLALADS